MAFIEPMHRKKPNITYLLTWTFFLFYIQFESYPSVSSPAHRPCFIFHFYYCVPHLLCGSVFISHLPHHELLWLLCDKGTCVRFCLIPSHCGIAGNESGPTSKRDPRPRYKPTGKCPLYRFEATGQLLHSAFGSNQVGCSCTWQGFLPREINTGATKEIPALNRPS